MRPIVAPALWNHYDTRVVHAPVRPAVTGLEAVAGELRARLLDELAAATAAQIARCAFVVTEDGVEVLNRADLVARYKRVGLRPLVMQVRAAPLGRACVVVEAPLETAVLAVDHRAWLASEGRA